MISRRERLRSEARAAGFNGLVVTQLSNIRYLTGFSGSNAALLVAADDAAGDLLVTDGRYDLQVREECPDLATVIGRASVSVLGSAIAKRGMRRVAMESACSSGDLMLMREQVPEVERVDGLVEALRMVKEEAEIEALATACAITAQAMGDLADEIGPGWTEIAVARRLEQRFGELGADDRSFATIVAAGAHAAKPHHRPTSRPLQTGDLVVVDAGALVRGYHADMTRTFVVGVPADWQVELHACVADAAQIARQAAVPDAALAPFFPGTPS